MQYISFTYSLLPNNIVSFAYTDRDYNVTLLLPTYLINVHVLYMALTCVFSGFFWPHSIPGNPGAPGSPDGPYGPGIIQGKVIPVNGNM